MLETAQNYSITELELFSLAKNKVCLKHLLTGQKVKAVPRYLKISNMLRKNQKELFTHR